jgi:hypothetical protein
MKALMLNVFKEKLDDLTLAPNKRHSLVDFISILSVMATNACTVKNIQHIFIEAGMIDVDNLRYPVFDRIMEEYKNIESNMDMIINESYEFRHISEEVYDCLGIAKNRDGMGREVMPDGTISQES